MEPTDLRYRFFEHTADLGLEIYGRDPADLFANAGAALFDAILQAGDAETEYTHNQTLEVQGDDWADLMVNWLKELLYLFNGEQQVLVGVRIEALAENSLKAIVATRDLAPGRDQIGQEIKAVTYHQIQAGPEGGHWRAKVILDI